MPATVNAIPAAVHDSCLRPTVLVLASGRGERFIASGGTTHKLQALLAQRTILDHTLAAVKASGLPWYVEDRPHPGMGDSIAAAVAATSTSAGWLILPADLPLVQPTTLRAVADALARFEVVVPFHEGIQGHPVGFSRACLAELVALHGDRGAAAVVRAHPLMALAVNDVGCVTDVDTVAQLNVAASILANPRARRTLR